MQQQTDITGGDLQQSLDEVSEKLPAVRPIVASIGDTGR